MVPFTDGAQGFDNHLGNLVLQGGIALSLKVGFDLVGTPLPGKALLQHARAAAGADDSCLEPLERLLSRAPAGIDCGMDCTDSYVDGTVVTLTASADTGSTFSGWSGACTNTSGDCLVTMSEAKSVIATFTLNQYLLSVSLAGDGNGSVSSDPTGIDCGTDCSESYDYGSLVTLTASADSNSTFEGWSGDCSGTDDCVATMEAAKVVTATFEAEELPIPPTGLFEVFLPLAQLNH